MAQPHISLAPETLTNVGGLPITNALLTSWLVTGLLVIISLAVTSKLRLVPTKGQTIAELVIGGLYNFFGSVTGKYVALFFPLVASLFIFIIASNWVGLLPGVGTVGFHEGEGGFLPLFRAATTDLNTTIALAVVAVISIQYYGFKTVGKHYLNRFINFSNPINFAVGLLEVVSEFSKIISFAFRLFGNIFAGEVLLTVMAFLIPFIVPLPFLMLELFVGFIQALVFSMLTAVFLNVAVSYREEH